MVTYIRQKFTTIEMMILNAKGANYEIHLPRVEARMRAIKEASYEALRQKCNTQEQQTLCRL